jgi:hypothetical protein
MQELKLPKFDFQIRETAAGKEIFDPLRKKFIHLTPEEWVRQNLVQLLIQKYLYPKGLISLEKGLKYGKLAKRTDILVRDRNGNPFLLIECKSPSVILNQEVFSQAASYNHTIKASYLMISNGMNHLCCAIDHQQEQYNYLNDLPSYP